MQFIWLAFSLLLGAVLELLIGGWGVLVPMVALVAFHFGVLRHYWHALLMGCTVGIWVDMTLGRSFPLHLILVPVCILLARLWRRQQLTYMLPMQAVPGFIAGLCCGGIYAFWRTSSMMEVSWADYRSLAIMVLLCGFASGLAYPLICLVLEWGAFRLDLQRYSRVGADYLAENSDDEEMEVVNVDD